MDRVDNTIDITITGTKELDFRRIREILNEVDKSVNPKGIKVWRISVTGITGVAARTLADDTIGEITLVDIKFNQVKEISEPVKDPVEDALRRSLHRAGEPEPYFTVEIPLDPSTQLSWMQQLWSDFWSKIF